MGYRGTFFDDVFCLPSFQVVSCTRTKDRGRYLPEWVAYHWALGVDVMDIYDDDSVDDTREVSPARRGQQMAPSFLRATWLWKSLIESVGVVCSHVGTDTWLDTWLESGMCAT